MDNLAQRMAAITSMDGVEMVSMLRRLAVEHPGVFDQLFAELPQR